VKTDPHRISVLKETEHRMSSAPPSSINAAVSRRRYAGIAARGPLGGADGVMGEEICVNRLGMPTATLSQVCQARIAPTIFPSSRPRFGSICHSLPFSIDSPYTTRLRPLLRFRLPDLTLSASNTAFCRVKATLFCVVASTFKVHAPLGFSMLR
jgi:hypothetical protein